MPLLVVDEIAQGMADVVHGDIRHGEGEPARGISDGGIKVVRRRRRRGCRERGGANASTPTIFAPAGSVTGWPVTGLFSKKTGMAPSVSVPVSAAGTGLSGANDPAGGGVTRRLFAQPR